MTLLIRNASESDIPHLVSFNLRLAEETEDKRLDPVTLERGVRRALASPNLCRYYVAEDAGEVIGQTMITFEITDWRDGIAYWIQSVYVQKSHRGKGVFRKIYEHICNEAREASDVRLIRLYVEEHNDTAIAVYGRLGMERTHYNLYEVEIQN